jgi:hypothetical protein
MSEQESGTQIPPVENAESTPATEVQVETLEQKDSNSETTNPEQTGSEPSGAEKRIKQLAAQRTTEREGRIKAENEAAYYKGLAEGGIKTQVKPAAQPATNAEPVRPNLDDFDTFDAFTLKNEEYLIEMAQHRYSQKQERDKAEAQSKDKQTAFDKRIEVASAIDPEIDLIRRDMSLPVSRAMAEIIEESEHVAPLLKWIDSHRKEALAIAQMSPLLAAREMGKLEASFAKVEPAVKVVVPKVETKRVSAAPEPISTVGVTSASTVDEDGLSMEEYHRRRTKSLYGK